MNAALQFDWTLHVSEASPTIWACETRPLLLALAGWYLGTRLAFVCNIVHLHICTSKINNSITTVSTAALWLKPPVYP